MSLSRNLFAGKRKYVFGLIVLATISVICAAFITTGGDDFDMARREVLLRRLGDKLLLQSGDSTSRVLPVKKIADNEYQINFEHAFAFKPDSLINITQSLMSNEPLARDYVVNVLNSGSSTIAYGYAISQNKKDNNIIPCRGRTQPKGLYLVNVKFKPAGIIATKNGYLLGSLPLLAFLGFIFLRSARPRKALLDDQATGTFNLGSVLFDAEKHQLVINNQIIDLTGTETRLMLIFASLPNEIIARSRLQKEIWEDEGVIVGRSLDMFISKLRKKLEGDSNVNIIVVRGKGYKLEVG